MIRRQTEELVLQNVSQFPAVAILGSRQCGKSTLVKMLSHQFANFLYLDLQNRDHLAMLSEPSLFFKNNENRTICLDEIQLYPELFSVLRVEIDRFRRPSRFILLGSASRKLVQHTSETLAGRIGLIDLTPFMLTEVNNLPDFNLNKFWLRGGYPDSYLSVSDEASNIWRENFIRTYIEHDIPQFGLQITNLQIYRLLSILAHCHGQLLNASKLGDSLNVSHPTIRNYIDILEQTYILRTLPPFFVNTKKRLVKAPKLYIRDSGILHQILQIADFNALLGHPIFGSSWEGVVVENVCSAIRSAQFSFYRSATGDEMDLVVQKGDHLFAIECKASTAPHLTQNFWRAIDFLQPTATFVVAPVERPYSLKNDVIVCGIPDVIGIISEYCNKQEK